jgi:hypothetical protein
MSKIRTGILTVVVAFASISLIYTNLYSATPEGVKLALKQQETQQVELQARIAEATGAVPPGWTRPSATPTADGGLTADGSMVTLSTFPCPQGEERQSPETYLRNGVQTVSVASSSRIPAGCAVVRVNGTISRLEGENYMLYIFSGQLGSYYKCGTYDGFNNTPDECVRLINQHAIGQNMIVGVQSGNYLAIN